MYLDSMSEKNFLWFVELLAHDEPQVLGIDKTRSSDDQASQATTIVVYCKKKDYYYHHAPVHP